MTDFIPTLILSLILKLFFNKCLFDCNSSLNSLLYSLLGLQIPSHVITQLSIGKTGIIQNFLNNLRICILMNSAAKDSKTIDHIVLYEWLAYIVSLDT